MRKREYPGIDLFLMLGAAVSRVRISRYYTEDMARAHGQKPDGARRIRERWEINVSEEPCVD